jgi:hypothetical protein
MFPALTACLAAAGLISSAHAQIQSAGALFVNVDATVAPLGTLNAITNAGTLGGLFQARGGGTTVPSVVVDPATGARGIQFDGNDYMQHVTSIGGAVLPAPSGLVGVDPTRSIEVWVLNPSIDSEETLVSWGRRGGPSGSNMSFNYGTHGAFGAVGHWGSPDIGWVDEGGAPAAGQWHHLVYTYDGTTTRVYADGVLWNSEFLGSGVINTHANTPINLATQLEGDGTTPTGALRGSLTLARVRVHDGVLSLAQIQNNYNLEKDEFSPNRPVTIYEQPQNRTAAENSLVSFSVGAAGAPPLHYQWRRAGDPIAGATNATHSFFATLSDAGEYSCVVSNFFGGTWHSATSSNAVLTLTGDDSPPVLLRAHALKSNVVQAVFNERLRADSVPSASYLLTGPQGGVAVHQAALDFTQTNVLLTTDQIVHGADYTLTVSGVRDASSAGHEIAPNSSVSFRADLRPRVGSALLLHRYSFSNAPTNNATGLTLVDSVSGSNGVVRGSGAAFTGTRLALAGGPSGSAAYGDLPNRLLSNTSADRGGAGGVTIETWIKLTGNRTWSRIFDIGSTSPGGAAGELQGPGGGGEGLDYFMISAQIGGDVNSRRVEVRNVDGAPVGGIRTLDYSTTAFNTDLHLVATWNESNGEIHVYENARLVGTLTTPERISSINDVNVWLGRSNWTADQNAEGEFDEFRIYGGILTSNEVTATFLYGPDRIPVTGPPTIVVPPANLTVTELLPATFSIEFGGFPFPNFQWLKNGEPIPGATNSSYTLPSALLLDNGARFSVIAANVVDGQPMSVTSSEAVLTVLPDTTGPALVSAMGLTLQSLLVIDGVQVEFSEGVLPGTATNLSNYVLTGPAGVIPLTGATLDSSLRVVSLAAGATLTEGATYTLTVNGVRDRAVAGNLIAPNSQLSFVVAAFALRTVGTVSATNSFELLPGGYNVNAAGRDIGGTSDDFGFHSQIRTGDFDVRVRVDSLDLSNGYSVAGLMARAGLETNAMFAAVLASPSLGGVKFQARLAISGTATNTGAMPVNYPNTWLRLQRAGNVFTGFGSFDGQTWMRLGSATIEMPSQVYLGFAVSSHDTSGTVSARFRDPSNVSGGTIVSTISLPFEPLGPSSRKTPLVISEIMYHPADLPGVTNSLEFIEIYNAQEFYEDLTGFRIIGDIEYNFADGTILESGGFLVIARSPATVESVYGISGVLGPFTGNLPNSSGTLILENENGGQLLVIQYGSNPPWPASPDGAGHSLVLARPSYGEGDSRAWAPSEFVGGSPGRAESYLPEPMRHVVINEFLAHAGTPDFIELFNRGAETIDLSGAWLTDNAANLKFQIPAGTTVAPGGFVVFYQNELGFGLDADGEDIFLVNASRTRVIDSIRFGGQAFNVSTGRFPDGAPGFRELSSRTPGASNTAPLRREIVINEIMYNPISGNNDDEYIELYNRGTATVDLSGWRIEDGIRFTIPENTIIPADGYLVIAKNRTNLFAKYSNLNAGNTVGDYNGNLSNSGERIALIMPEFTNRTNAQGTVTTTMTWVLVNEVSYGSGRRWGEWSDGGGSSLELVDPRSDNTLAANWADSDESGKAPWTLIERTGIADLGMSSSQGTPNRFEFFLQGPGECLVDDMEIRSNNGPNLISNPGFETGVAGWAFQGTHAQTLWEPNEGYNSSASLRVRAVERGDPGANRIRTGITTIPVGGNNTVTLRARARWIRGDTNILLRVRGNWLEAPGGMALPSNLGTPGARNSRVVPNAGPAIYDVAHAPILPPADEPVVVTARVSDPDGIGQVTLRYRLDPSLQFLEVPMRDDGTGGDARANDGLFSATIPAQPAGTLVAFHIVARDGAVIPAQASFPSDATVRECLVRFGESVRPGKIGNYRLWVTQANLTRWATRERNSNEPLDATFVYNDSRVIYNAGTLYSGSPWHTPTYTGPLGVVCDYEVEFDKDDMFLGAKDFVLNGQAGGFTFFNNDVSAQAETTAYWFGRKLGLQFNHKRQVHVFLNGQPRGMIYFDHQQPNRDVLRQYFPDDFRGRLHKIEDWFEFDDAGAGQNIITARLTDFQVGGVKRTERYRWTWRPRAVSTSPNDFADLFALIDAVNAPGPEPYTSAVLGLVDIDNWMRVFALQHMIGNWDTYGYERGKNMYTYKPTRGPWKLLLWDLDLVLGKESRAPDHGLFVVDDPTIARMYGHPPFVRDYWAAFKELVDGPMRPEVYGPLVDARFNAFRANGLAVDTPTSMKNWIAARRSYILSQIPNAAFNVSGPASFQSSSNLITLTGTAPIGVKTVTVNGAAYPITWTGVTTWSLRVPLQPGVNQLEVRGVDRSGNPVPNASRDITVEMIAAPVQPEEWVLINEIMFSPLQPGTAWVELFNRHTSAAFDLSGWRISGLGYTFPAGSVLGPRGFLVLAENRSEFVKVYGSRTLVFDEFAGRLRSGGETLTLLRPGPEEELVVNKVKYESAQPWPPLAAAGGASIQVVDPAQDNSRVSNWSDGSGWRFYSLTGVPAGTRLLFYLDSIGVLHIDDVKLVRGSVAGAGENLIRNGGFEQALDPDWLFFGSNGTNSTISTEIQNSGESSLELRFHAPGGPFHYIYQDIPDLITTNTHTLSFWYLPSTNATNLWFRMSTGFRATINVRAPASGPIPFSTPGASNSVLALRDPYPLLWLNEVLPANITGISDGQGQREPWIELFNSGAAPISLDGYYLSDNYANLTKWAFPTGAVIQPGEFKVVFADAQPAQSTASEWHTNFRLAPGTGSVALSRDANGAMQIIDYLNYSNLPDNSSYGSIPDGQLFAREAMFFPTPGSSNSAASRPITVFVNEWMASNTSTLRDPADNRWDDWFELYNPGPEAVDLGGYYLTDNLSNPFQFRIPAGYSVPAGGFLLVWADNEPNQNSSARPDLHVNFQLARGGESIGLFAADGTLIDAVTFGEQTSDVSQGRFPDGAAAIYFMADPTPRGPNVLSGPGAPPQIGGVSLLPGGGLSFHVQLAPGARYRIEYKPDLNAPAWIPLGPEAVATGGSVTVTDDTASNSQRFYRVVVLE